MTAHSNPTTFTGPPATAQEKGVYMRPNVEDRFFGYEVRANQETINTAVILRALVGLFAVATSLATIGIWLLPAMAFAAQAFASKVIVSVILICVSVLMARIAARGTRIRVQVDTSVGELREVVDGPFGSDIVLAHYGFDAVEAVELVSSQTSRSFGQIHVRIKGVGIIPAGDGAITALAPLQDRLKSDLGFDDAAREAVWHGPHAA